MPDPYTVLGVTPTTSDEEVKKAYHKLVKRYHPDMHPGDEECERKMKEVNAAYDAIINKDKYARSGRSPYGNPSNGAAGNYGGTGSYGEGGPSGNPYGRGTYGDPFGGYGWPFGGYTQSESPQTAAVKARLDIRDFAGALRLLENIPGHDARWHYLYAMAARGLGDNDTARDHAQRAVSMDPSNIEYRMYVESLGGGSRQAYTTVRPLGCGADFVKWIVIILLANLLLNLLFSLLSGGSSVVKF